MRSAGIFLQKLALSAFWQEGLLFPRLALRTGCHPGWSSLLHLGFFLVHSYKRVGLYQFSTVNHCRLARAPKYRYAKVTTQIAIVLLAFLLFFVKPNQKPWAFSATASAAAGGPPAPVRAQRAWLLHHWQCLVHFFLEKFKQGGEVCINFHFGGK